MGRTAFTTALVFMPPALSAGAALASLPVFGVGPRIYRPVALASGLLAGTGLFAFWAAYVHGGDMREGLEALKFVFMSLCLVSGYWLAVSQRDIQRLALTVGLLLIGGYALIFEAGIQFAEAFRPPDNNGSAILLFCLAFIVADARPLWARLAIMAVLFVFAEIAESRLLLVLLPFFFLSQPVALSPSRVLLIVVLCVVVYVWTTAAGMWGQWSDLVRLDLYATVIDIFANAGIPLVAEGQANFVSDIMANLPLVISQRLELAHAHNAFFQVLGSYGLIAGALFTGAMATLLHVSVRLRSDTLRNQMLFLIFAMLIETLVSDSRVAYVVFLFVGLQIGVAHRRHVGGVNLPANT